jgi:hypothetical protein
MTSHVPSTAFKPGTTGNPGGRPRAAREATVEARRFAIEAVHALVKTMRRAGSDGARIGAARELLDRALGKAPQSVDLLLTKQISAMSIDELATLEQQITGVATMTAIEPSPGDLFADDDSVLGKRITLDDLEPIEAAR